MADSLGEIVTSQRVSSVALALLLTSGAMTASRVPEGRRALQRVSYNQPLSGGSYTASGLVAEASINYAEQLARMLTSVEEDRDVTLLAKISGVSRKTYYEWLSGATIRPSNIDRLRSLVTLLADVREQRPKLHAFLVQPIDGKSPADYLHEERGDIVIGLSYGVHAPVTQRRTSTGRPLRSIPFAEALATREAVRSARRIRDYADDAVAEPSVETNDDESAPSGFIINIG